MTSSGTSHSELGRQRLLLARIRALEDDLARVEGEFTTLSSRLAGLESRIERVSVAIESHDRKLHELRLDRQLRRIPKWLRARFAGNDPRAG